MKTKSEVKVKALKKGFHPYEGENRKSRRTLKSNYGLHNFSKGWVMNVIGNTRFLTWLQPVQKEGRTIFIQQTKQL